MGKLMLRIAAVFLLVNALMAQEAGCDKTKRTTMSTSAQEYIAAFKRGENFVPPAKGVFAGGQPDEAALQVLAGELAVAEPNVRENIVDLLVDMGRSTDPLTKQGADVLRHPRILEILAGPGLAKPDMGREAAMDALRKLATQRDLARFDTAFTNALALEPTSEAFLLVAKAKSHKAKELIDRLMKLPKWQEMESAKIANAALGSTEDEEKFLAAAAAAVAANDGKALAAALGPLSLMGTQRSLKFIAEQLRSPLTIDIPGHMPGRSVKSVRLNVLDALLYNFPDQPVLYPNNINRDEDYRAAERFCSATLGTVYKDPPPPYLKFGNIPEPMRR